MTRRVFLDTNILLYSISRTSTETAKRERAEAILERTDCALSVQVLQEFYVQATRVSRTGHLIHDDAIGLINSWLRYPVQDMTTGVMQVALALKAVLGFSYWDSAVIAAAQALGCDALYTEDLSHGQVIDGLTIINPFR